MAMIPRLLQRIGISRRDPVPQRPAPSDVIPSAPPQQILGVPQTIPDPIFAAGSGPVPRMEPDQLIELSKVDLIVPAGPPPVPTPPVPRPRSSTMPPPPPPDALIPRRR